MNPRVIAQVMLSTLEKLAAAGNPMASQALQAPEMPYDPELAALEGLSREEIAQMISSGQFPEGMPPEFLQPPEAEEEPPTEDDLRAQMGLPRMLPSPGMQVSAPDLQQLSSREARGYSVLPPPPGYVYDPSLTAFVPDAQDPGWIPQAMVPQATDRRDWYVRGQQDHAVDAARGELEQAAASDMAAASQQQEAAMQQEAVLRSPEAMRSAARAAGEAEGEAAVRGQAPGARSPGRGAPVTIHIRK